MKAFISRRDFLKVSGAAAAAAALAGCSSGSSGSAGGKTVKIGVFEPASGDNGAGGKQEVLGIEYANSVAPTVDIGGETYNVELVEVDNQSSTDKAVTAAQELVSKKGVCGAGQLRLRRFHCRSTHLPVCFHPRHRLLLHQPRRHRGEPLLFPRLLPGPIPGLGHGKLCKG